METSLKSHDPAKLKTPALIVFLLSEDDPALEHRPELAGLKSLISPRLKQKDFVADHAASLILFPETQTGPARVMLVGLGPKKEFTLEKMRLAAAKAAQTARDLALNSVTMILPPAEWLGRPLEEIAESALLGAYLGQYQFAELKTDEKDKKKPLDTLIVLTEDKIKNRASLLACFAAARITAQAIGYARDLINRPANLLYPETLAREAASLSREVGLEIKTLNPVDAQKKGLGAFLAVAQGSRREGQVIILEYKGADPQVSPVALVGKAITFDSGGLCLKPPDGMKEMKTDMAGGAVVLAVLAAAARLELKVNLVGVIPAAENMPGGASYRPGDVLTSLSGQTIEVVNTDAEGRLILCDALTLAAEYKPRSIIDIATLTGACVVALGEKCAGLMGNEPRLLAALKTASEATGERVWELPLFDDYFDALKSEVADFKHAAGRSGGTILAALFLKKFIGDLPWAHVDIAGPARADKPSPDTPVGATGFGVSLLLKYLRNLKMTSI